MIGLSEVGGCRSDNLKVPLGSQGGFTLIEIAIAVIMLGLLLGGLLMPLATHFEQQQRRETLSTLDEVQEALYGFAMVNDRLICPDCRNEADCPTIPASGRNDGREDRVGTPPACVTTPGAEGNLPWVDLGLPGSDAWSQQFSYHVTSDFADEIEGTGCGIPAAGVSFSLCSIGNITVLDGSGGDNVATQIPAIILSRGKNWAVSTSDDENENDGSDRTYVYKGFSATLGNEYDDLVAWISPHILKNRMVTAGKLP